MNADLAEMAEMNIELTDMLNDLTNSFDRMQEAFQNSGDQWRTATLQHITQLTTEITRVRARRMRHSFEASLARQAADRRRRTSSDSSTDSDNSDIDLDFAYPIDLCQFTTTSTNDQKNEEDQSMEVGDSEENNSAAITDSTSTPSNNSSSSFNQTGEQLSAVKRKMSFSLKEAPPAKRTMATSTDDSYFQKC
ncbi:hypothetical protein GCK72_023861 [Caenorhabditis remanei]|uniref:Uncharacterized protein n=1 Tax=Caenorhabditis remanei TaxID=31234 RepID=A0A6A5FYF6_CAERE|nr:hypothetical protein GCK72_023861 [Caenorhabditis remanei]KAF1747399.1 hypothetical protein GCK72_023861 [Caenorhabditis remanei]